MNKKCVLLLCMAVVLAGCDERSAAPLKAAQPVRIAGEIGSRMPDFSVTDLKGHPVSSLDLRGKVVLVDFWATWCQPCEREMPGYQKLVDRYGAQGFQAIGFKFDTMADLQDPLQFAKKIGVSYPLATATEEIKKEFGGIEGLPTTMIYDRQGVLRAKIVGFEYTAVIKSTIKPFLSEQRD